MILLDTHIWIWLAENDSRLNATNKAFLERSKGDIVVSTVSVWEIAMLVNRRRLTLHRNARAWLALSLEAMQATLVPLDADIALESYALPGEFHGDPADRMIIATARQKGFTLITQDKDILTYARKGHVLTGK